MRLHEHSSRISNPEPPFQDPSSQGAAFQPSATPISFSKSSGLQRAANRSNSRLYERLLGLCWDLARMAQQRRCPGNTGRGEDVFRTLVNFFTKSFFGKATRLRLELPSMRKM